jgi:SAM-dependent methyltransferase
MSSSSGKTNASAAQVRDHFRRNASAFDALYDEDGFLQRRVRPGLGRRRALALEAVASYPTPSVLDVGCGSGRIAEDVLEHGASRYVGVDFSEPMLELAGRRLERFGPRVVLVQGDFLEAPVDGLFDVVLALGLFDYLPEAAPFVARMRELCSGSLVASFPGWNWFKGPIRKARYEVVHRVPIFDYTEPGLRRLLGDGGFSRVEIVRPGKSGYVVRARP